MFCVSFIRCVSFSYFCSLIQFIYLPLLFEEVLEILKTAREPNGLVPQGRPTSV